MQLTNTATRYGSIHKAFHWSIAVLLIANIVLSQIGERISAETNLALKADIYSAHKTIGVAIFFVALARILWAISQPKPVPLHPERRLETFAADLAHWILYGALVIVPLTGWIYHAASEGFAPILWPFPQNLPGLVDSTTVADWMKTAHHVATKVLFVALVAHIAGALKHALWDRDSTLKRMWFGDTEAGRGTGHGLGPALPVAAVIWAGSAIVVLALMGAPEEQADAQVQAAGGGNWAVQSGEIGFEVVQLGSPIQGVFNDWTADIVFDEATGTGTVRTQIDVGSLTLGSVTQEALGAQYFAAEEHPTAIFEGNINPDGDAYVATGTLELSGQTSDVTLPFTLMIDGDTASMDGSVTLSRESFGIGEGQSANSLGIEVPVRIELTATRAE
ncbi:hypothetical protein PARPLA_02846 [Rhodobacteraceae bacterium THAF1]|uniref:cytochrome b/b6 domain-containing protein n=1 Tax=Palleronia sp. THAF1 TaxID=2587842 RepID=UPI000F3F09D0|nr:cytochrome b/b6 domain-containing protein [Palleronia sp. THAF1]QFU08248.1 hypothetical protein FIU81_06140 [Palleronia sp. THAF1]VDC28805.1 hypothetical protein PARPLA_02846 [Rhodobacteraceae bacterium THAF1]